MTAVRRRLKPACVPACPRLLAFSSLLLILLLPLQPFPSAALDHDGVAGPGGLGAPESWSSRALRVTRSDVNISRAEEAERAGKGARPGRYQRLQRKVAELKSMVRDITVELTKMKRSMISLVSPGKCSKGMCPIGSMKYGCDCLLYVHRELTWPEASSHCINMSAKLVTIYSKGIQKHIKAFLEAQLGRSGARQHQTYTGLIYTKDGVARPSFVGGHHEISTSGTGDGWYWLLLNGTTAPLHHFRYWADNHTQAGYSLYRQSCMHLDGNDNFRWVSSHCDRPRHFICHFSAVPKRLRRAAEDHSAGQGVEDGGESVRGRRGRRGESSSDRREESRERKSKEQQENG